jgi:hypothetical protein
LKSGGCPIDRAIHTLKRKSKGLGSNIVICDKYSLRAQTALRLLGTRFSEETLRNVVNPERKIIFQSKRP